jgi:hypothetical protein
MSKTKQSKKQAKKSPKLKAHKKIELKSEEEKEKESGQLDNLFLTLREGIVETIDSKKHKHHKKKKHSKPHASNLIQLDADIQLEVASLSHQRSRSRLRDDDMSPDEAAEKALHGMAHSVIGEEKAELASNKPSIDLKIDSNLITIDDGSHSESDTSNAFSTPVEEVHFDLSNPQDNKDNVKSEQDKILLHQQEIENLANKRST